MLYAAFKVSKKDPDFLAVPRPAFQNLTAAIKSLLPAPFRIEAAKKCHYSTVFCFNKVCVVKAVKVLSDIKTMLSRVSVSHREKDDLIINFKGFFKLRIFAVPVKNLDTVSPNF